MPRKPRTPEQVQKVRQDILDKALELISEEGFENLSMRNLAAKLNMTATPIYAYFANKDELYLAVLQEGFELLYAKLEAAAEGETDPMARLRACVRAFADFGVNNPNFYNIMLVNDVPKYYDYVGSPYEETASREMDAAMKVRNYISRLVLESGVLDGKTPEETMPAIIHFFCAVHGFIVFINSQITDYLFEEGPRAIDEATLDAFLTNAIDLMKR